MQSRVAYCGVVNYVRGHPALDQKADGLLVPHCDLLEHVHVVHRLRGIISQVVRSLIGILSNTGGHRQVSSCSEQGPQHICVTTARGDM